MFRRSLRSFACNGLSLLGVAGALATDTTWTFRVSNCQPGTVFVTFELPPNPPIPVPIPIPHAMDGRQKAQWIRDHIGIAWDPTASGSSFSISADSRMKVSFSTGTTAERLDGITCASASIGGVGFTGFFAPMDFTGQPAVFTAGIVTDVGELSAQISSQELNFQTDGPIICQALFQRLAPRAPQYGAQINYAGDRLEVYFDPAYTVTQGGILFGTTSQSPGCTGSLESSAPQNPCPEDINGDGVVDLADLARILSSYGTTSDMPGYDPAADLDGDGDVDLDDLARVLSNFGRECGN